MQLADLGRDTVGLWTRAQALQVLSRGRVDSLVRQGCWDSPWPGVLRDTGSVLDPRQRAWAGVLASGGSGQPYVGDDGRRRLRAVAAGRTSARLLGLPLIDDADPATGAVDHLHDDVAVDARLPALTRTWHDGKHVLHRRRLRLGRADLVRHPDGLWTTAPLRTLVDLAGLLTPEALTCAVDRALHVHLVTEAELQEALAERAWCRGAAVLRWAVAHSDRRAESAAETLARLVLRPVLPALEPQVTLAAGGRVVARFDLGDRQARFAVEADGWAGHSGTAMAAKDHRRDRVSGRQGWRTERCTWWELRRDRPALVRRMVEAAEEHRAGPRRPPA